MNMNEKYYGKIILGKNTQKEQEFDLFLIEESDSHESIIKIYKDGQEMDQLELMRTYGDIGESIKDILQPIKEKTEDINPKTEENKTVNDLKETEKEKKLEEKQKTDTKEKEEEEEHKLTADTMGATNLNQQVDRVSLRNILGIEPDDEYIKPISREEAHRKYGEYPNTKDAFEIIKKNGESRIADQNILVQDRQEGNNSSDRDLNVNVNGKLDYHSNTSSFEIVNKPGYYLSVGYDEGTSLREIKIARRSRFNGDNEVENVLTKKGDSKYENSDKRNAMRTNPEGIEETDNTLAREEEHKQLGCENDEIKNIDDHPENDTHKHLIHPDDKIEGTNTTWREFSNACGFRDSDAIEKAYETLKKYQEDRKYQDLENSELIKAIEEDELDMSPARNKQK